MVVRLQNPITNEEYQNNYKTSASQRFGTAFIGSGSSASSKANSFFGRCVTVVDSCSKFDKCAKLVDASLAMHIAANPDTVSSGIKSAHQYTKDVRLFMGAGKVLGGIWRVMAAIRNIFTISSTIGNDEKPAYLTLGGFVRPTSNKKPEQYSQILKNDSEKQLGIFSNVLGLIANAAFTVGFGGCKLIKLATKLDPGAIARSARSFANKMGQVMMVNHVAGIIKDFIDMRIEALTYRRAEQEFDLDAVDDAGDGLSVEAQSKLIIAQHKIEQVHTNSCLRLGLTTFKHGLECGADAAMFTAVPLPVSAGLQLGVALTDFICTWTTTA